MKTLKLLSLAWTLVLLFALNGRADAQLYLNYSFNQPPALTADAGEDQLICPGASTTLGGNPTASGGYGGYNFTWLPVTGLNNASASNPVTTLNVTTVYLLTMTDTLGCTDIDTVEIAMDTCTSIGTRAGIQSFEVYPNPNQGRFTVSVDLGITLESLTIRVTDLNGRTLFSKKLEQPAGAIREQIHLQDLSRGAYFIQIEADGIQMSRKMILR